MANQADICNLAIARIGEREFISNIDEDTGTARACKVLYTNALEVQLASFHWPFAKKSAVLTAADVADREDWGYTYQLPSDCLIVRHIWSGSRTPDASARVPFELELDADSYGRVLLTDMASAQIVYTKRLTTAVNFPPLFVDALAWRLASELAMTVANRPDLAVRAAQAAELAFSRATASALNETSELQPESEFITARR